MRGEGGQHADGQGAMRATTQFRHAALDAVQRVAHRRGEFAAWLGQLHTATAAPKQRNSQFALERLHLMTDRPVRDVQFSGGAGEVAVARGGLERAECMQRWQAVRHV